MTEPFIPFGDPYKRAFAQALAVFGDDEMISGIDVGYRPGTKALAVRVFCRATSQEKAEEYFKSQKGYSRITDAEVLCLPAVYRTHSVAADRERQLRLAHIRPGVSVSHRRTMGGTIGLIVYNAGTPCILSNRHVLAGTPDAKAGDAIVQPATNFEGRVPRDRIGELLTWILDADGDAALARLSGERPIDPKPFGTDDVIGAPRMPRQDEVVTKSGAKTGVTTGRVDGFGRYYVRYPGFERPLGINGFKVVPLDSTKPGELSSEGDSGAVWYSKEEDTSGLGLHVAGELSEDPRSEMAIACYLERVLTRLDAALEPPRQNAI